MPKEIPTSKDFGMNIGGEYFKMEINQMFKTVTFSDDKEDAELTGKSILIKV